MSAQGDRVPGAKAQRVLTLVALLPILATVYQTLVLTDLADADIRRGIESDPGDSTWLSAAWGLSTLYGVFIGLGLSKKLRPRNTLIIGLFLFSVGNLLCGLANGFIAMIAARMVEGLGKGMCIILLRSYLYARFDRMLFAAVLCYGLFAYSTRGTSPLVAAWVNEIMGWRWVYWANMPLGVLGMVLVAWLIPPDPRPAPVQQASGESKPDALVIHLLIIWLMSLLFLLGWRGREGGGTSNLILVLIVVSVVVFVALVARLAVSLKNGDNISRLLRSRSYLGAMGCRMLLLLHLAALMGVLSKYMVELRGYPAVHAGWAFVPATFSMAAGFLVCVSRKGRDWRHLCLLLGALGASASILWLAQVDLATPWHQIALRVLVWGFFVGALPGSFLIDEVEGLEKSDLPVAAAFAIVVLATPLILVPALMGTLISDQKEAAFDHQRQWIRSSRPVVGATLARGVEHFTSRGMDMEQATALSAGLIAAMVQLQSASIGIQSGLLFLSLFTGILGMLFTLPLLFSRLKLPG